MFTDGSSTRCCDEHLWKVRNAHTKRWRVLETRQFLDANNGIHRVVGHKYKIPMTKPVNFAHQDIVIDPYIMGVLLGDGALSTGSPRFTSADPEIVEEVSSRLVEGYEVKSLTSKYDYNIRHKSGWNCGKTNIYMSTIRAYNLDVNAADKHIPRDYLFNDVESRIALL